MVETVGSDGVSPDELMMQLPVLSLATLESTMVALGEVLPETPQRELTILVLGTALGHAHGDPRRDVPHANG